jgi:hypothetical protein
MFFRNEFNHKNNLYGLSLFRLFVSVDVEVANNDDDENDTSLNKT